MRKVTLGLANSLDNYIARKDGGSDWLHWDDEIAKLTAKFMKTVDAILIGRKTYEVMLAFGQTAYPGARNYVFSRTMKGSPNKKVEIVSADAARFVKSMKAKKGKGICLFGGGELARSLFIADLIDEIVLNIHPVLLGAGIPLFHEMDRQINLELIESQTHKRGNLIVFYRVKH